MAAVDITPGRPRPIADGDTPPAAAFSGSLADADWWVIPNNGRMLVKLSNTTAADRTATITSPATVGGLTVQDPTITVAANRVTPWLGPFDPRVYGDDLRIDTDGAGMQVEATEAHLP